MESSINQSLEEDQSVPLHDFSTTYSEHETEEDASIFSKFVSGINQFLISLTRQKMGRRFSDEPSQRNDADLETSGLLEPDHNHELGNSVGNISNSVSAGQDTSASPTVTPDLPLVVIMLLIFCAMCTGYSYSIISIYMNQELKYGPVEVTKFWLYLGFVAWIEPVVGLLTDGVVVFGERRRPMFILSILCSMLIFFLFRFRSTMFSNFLMFVGINSAGQLCMMAQHLCLNGILLDIGRYDGEPTSASSSRISAVLSKAMIWRCSGTLVGAVLQTFLLVRFSIATTLGIAALFYSGLLVLVFFTPRSLFLQPDTQPNLVVRVIDAIKDIKSLNLCDPESNGRRFFMVLFFVFLYTMMPDSGNVYYNYLFSYNFPSWYYSAINCIGFCGNTTGSFIFSRWMEYRAKKQALEPDSRGSTFFLFLVGSVAWAIGYATNIMVCTGFVENVLCIPVMYFLPLDYFLTSVFGVIAMVPIIISSTEHAPQGLELSSMQFFNVVSMAGSTLSSALTLLLLHAKLHDSLWMLILCTIISRFIIVPFAYLLPDRKHSAETVSLLAAVDEEDEEETM